MCFRSQNWGGKECGFGLADCCREDCQMSPAASTFYYEYYKNDGNLEYIQLDYLTNLKKDIRELTSEISAKLVDHLDDDQKYHIFNRIRLAMSFNNYQIRLKFVQARLQALSVLVYSDALLGYTHQLIYPGFLEELVELLELSAPHLMEIRSAALRTLTAIIHLERNSQYLR